MTDDGQNSEKSLGPENVLLRGARLRNTAFIYGKFLCCHDNYIITMRRNLGLNLYIFLFFDVLSECENYVKIALTIRAGQD